MENIITMNPVKLTNDKPAYKHDGCSKCQWLGTWLINFDIYDLYYCPQEAIPTVLARWDNEPPSYHSGWPCSNLVEEHPNFPTCVAYKEARKLGLGKEAVPGKYVFFSDNT